MSFGAFDSGNNGQPMAEINTTPLVDVMLVLLVIFIITAPLLTHSIKLELPKAEGSAAQESIESITLSIDPAGARGVFQLRAGGADVPGALALFGSTLVFTPSQRLAFDTTYAVQLDAGPPLSGPDVPREVRELRSLFACRPVFLEAAQLLLAGLRARRS